MFFLRIEGYPEIPLLEVRNYIETEEWGSRAQLREKMQRCAPLRERSGPFHDRLFLRYDHVALRHAHFHFRSWKEW